MRAIISLAFVAIFGVTKCSARLVDPACLQAPPVGVNAFACCRFPDFMDPTLLDNCAAKVMDDKDSPMDMAYGMTQEDVIFSPGIRCISECMLRDSNITVELNATSDPAAAPGRRHFSANATRAAIFKNYVGSADPSGEDFIWRQALEVAIEKCVAVVAEMSFEDVPQDECDVAPVFFMACLDTQMFRVCPEAVWKSDYGCDQLRQQTEHCPVLSAILVNIE